MLPVERDAGELQAQTLPARGNQKPNSLGDAAFNRERIKKSHTLDHDWTGRRIAPFNSHLGSGEGGTRATIAAAARGTRMLPGVGVGGRMVGAQMGKVDHWLRKIGATDDSHDSRTRAA